MANLAQVPGILLVMRGMAGEEDERTDWEMRSWEECRGTVADEDDTPARDLLSQEILKVPEHESSAFHERLLKASGEGMRIIQHIQ